MTGHVRMAYVAAAVTLAIAPGVAVRAGETITFHSQHANVATEFNQIEVPDEPGHIIATFKAKGIGMRRVGPAEPNYTINLWGTGQYRKDGTGSEHGYGQFTFADGATYFEEWKGEVANGRDVGTAIYYGGTGRFKNMKGSSKFECALYGDRFLCEVDGTLEMP